MQYIAPVVRGSLLLRRGRDSGCCCCRPTAATASFLLFGFNFFDNGINGTLGQCFGNATGSDHTDFHRLGTGIDYLQQSRYGQTEALLFGQIGTVLFFQKFTQTLGIATTNDLRLPSRMCPGRIGLIQIRSSGVVTNDTNTGHKSGNAKRSDTTDLRVQLLHTGQIPSHIINRGCIFHGKSVRLGMETDLVD